MKKQVSINFDVELLEKVEQYAKKININRSSAVAVLCNTALQQDTVMEMLPQLVKLTQKK